MSLWCTLFWYATLVIWCEVSTSSTLSPQFQIPFVFTKTYWYWNNCPCNSYKQSSNSVTLKPAWVLERWKIGLSCTKPKHSYLIICCEIICIAFSVCVIPLSCWARLCRCLRRENRLVECLWMVMCVHNPVSNYDAEILATSYFWSPIIQWLKKGWHLPL